MRMQRYRDEFNPEKAFLVLRAVRMDGEDLTIGSVFPRNAVPLRRLRQLFDQRKLGYAEETGRQRCLPPNPRRPVLIGYAAPMPEPPVEIPEGWRALPWPMLRSLARRFAKVPPANKMEAEDAVAAELERRAREADGNP